MAIGTGTVSIQDLVDEFGGSGTHSLSEYRSGQGFVASLLTDTDGNVVPSSGTIKLSDFRATAKFVAGSFTTLTQADTAVVPTGANAIHIEFAVGGGGGGCGGADYDQVGVESAGAGGGSGAYISDKVFTVVAGETITFAVGAAGSGVDISAQMAAQGTRHVQRAATFNSSCQQVATAGGTTSASGSSTGAIFTLTGGGGASGINGDVAGPARTNTAGTAGAVSHIDTGLTNSTFTNASNVGANLSTLTSGPASTFNDSGAGAVGSNNGNCSGDNCRIGGSTGGTSYDGTISGGTGGSSSGNGTAGGAGTRGSGGGGGAAQVTFPASAGSSGSTDGGNGGAGEIKFRFLRVNA